MPKETKLALSYSVDEGLGVRHHPFDGDDDNNDSDDGYKGLSFFSEGVPNILGHTFLERKIGGLKIFDDQNVGRLKMTTDSVFILFKKTDFNTVCLGGKVFW